MAATALDASLVSVACVAAVSDLRTRLIPDRALIAGLLAVPVGCALGAPAAAGSRLGWGAAAAGSLLAAALIRPGGMGLGDVKLAGVLGVYLRAQVITAFAVAFAAGTLAGTALVARHGWGARKWTIPFAPFLAAGTLAAVLSHS